MGKANKYNLYNQFSKTSRLILFALPARKIVQSDTRSQEDKKLFTKEQERICEELKTNQYTPYGQKIAKLYRQGKLEEKTFREVYEVAKDPNKMKKNSYKEFIKAVANNKFPKRGKFATRFLKALSGTKKEREYAEDIVRNLSEDATGPLTSITEKDHLKELTRLKEEDLAEETIEETSIKAGAVIEAADIGKRVEKLTEVKTENWAMEKPPAELIEKIEKAEIHQYKLAKQYNQKDEELKEELNKEKPDNQKVEILKKQLKDIDLNIVKSKKEVSQDKEEWICYLRRMLAGFRALKSFSLRAGLDMNKVHQLIMWFIDFKKTQEAVPSIEGITVDKKTGKVGKKRRIIQIDKIYFDTEGISSLDEDPGKLMVDYTYFHEDKKEKVTSTSYKNFLHEMDAFEGYEEVKTLDEFNEKFAFEIGYKDVKELVGEKFSTTVLEDLKENEKKYKKEEFTISDVKEENGEWVIELDQIVIKTPRQRFSNSVHPILYFDRKQKKFSLGEFGTFLRKNGYQREVDDEEMEQITEKIFLDKRKERESFVEGAPDQIKERFDQINGNPEQDLTPPREGENQNVICLDKYRRKKHANLTSKRDENGNIQYEAKDNEGKVINTWNKRDLMQAANKEEIENSKPDTPINDEPSPPEEAETGEEKKKTEGEEKQAVKKTKSKFYEEALPFDEINKAGGMQKTERGFLKSLWVSTKFLSLADIWEMGKTMYEYYKRRFERRQKEKYSTVGEDLPFFSPEMKRIKQAAENEQVNQFKESFEQFGIYEIQNRLIQTHNRDEFKAALITLNEKGQMRWDDIDMWRNLNRFVDPRLAIPIPSNGDPDTKISKDDDRTGFSFLKEAIDSLWGEGTYNGWYSQNKSAYISNAKNYYQEGNELEGVQGGHQRRLSILLKMHKEGEFVDPHEYEGLILHAIDYGKSSMQAKIYFMIEGVAAENKFGRTILSFDRIAHINSEMLPKFPLLEYITATARRPGGAHRFTIDDYKRWVKWFDEGNSMNSKPTKSVDNFMWKYVLPSDDTQNRINKAIRNGENLDHDDMFAYMPPATEEIVTDSCRATTGSKKFLTLEGYANVFPGFSQYIRSLAINNNRQKLVEAIKSYIRFEGIMTNRFEKEDKGYQRMSYATLNSGTIVTPDIPPQAYITQTNDTIDKIVEAYDDPELTEVYQTLRQETGDIWSDKNEKEKQNRVNDAFRRFGTIITKVIKNDEGEKMTSIAAGANLFGMPFLSDEEKERNKLNYSNKFELEY